MRAAQALREGLRYPFAAHYRRSPNELSHTAMAYPSPTIQAKVQHGTGLLKEYLFQALAVQRNRTETT